MNPAARMLFGLVLALAVLPSLRCATATAFDVLVFSEVDCAKNAAAVLLENTSKGGPSSTSTRCIPDSASGTNSLGNVVVRPSGGDDGSVDFAVALRPDGQPADACLAPDAKGCIVAKRKLRFLPHNQLDVRVHLRLACLDIPCAADQTCVKGTCVSSTVDPMACSGPCDETGLGDPDDATLSALALSAAPLEPAFSPTTFAYAAYSSGTGALPTTVTATPTTPGATLTIQGAPSVSGVPSAPIPLGIGPNRIELMVISRSGKTRNSYDIVVTGGGITYVKASNRTSLFGAVAMSGDTMVVGAYGDASAATGVNGNQSDTSAPGAGSAYVFVRTAGVWSQQAYLKASSARAGAGFGDAVAVDGDTIVVAAYRESSNATGVNGNQSDTSAPDSGSAYVFRRVGTTWAQEAYLKPSNTQPGMYFGNYGVGISKDTIVVPAAFEPSNATGVNGNQSDTSAKIAGAAYVFVRTAGAWSQQAYLKASNTRAGAFFGQGIAIDGDTLVVGAGGESSSATGVNGNQADTSAPDCGAVYVFQRTAGAWSQQAYLKASNARYPGLFGQAVSIAGDTLVVGAVGDNSAATGINGNQADSSAPNAGAAYVFVRAGDAWSQQAYLKASNAAGQAYFGAAVAAGGDLVVVGAPQENGGSPGLNGNQADTSMSWAGAAYAFLRVGGVWSQQAYVKATNPRANASFGCTAAVSANTLAIGSFEESSGATGINGNQADTSAPGAGAVYVY